MSIPNDGRIQKDTRFVMTGPRSEAAFLYADNRLSDNEIAAKVGVKRNVLFKWRQHQEFQEAISRHQLEIEKRILERGVCSKLRRLDELNGRWEKCKLVIEERAVDPLMAKVPGGKTGLVVIHWRVIGEGEKAKTVMEYRVDTGLLKELREIEKQAAVEMGQWVTKIAPTMPDGEESYVVGYSDSERREIIATILSRLGPLLASAGELGADFGHGPPLDPAYLPTPSGGDDGGPLAGMDSALHSGEDVIVFDSPGG